MSRATNLPAAAPHRLRAHVLADAVPGMRREEWQAFLADVAERGILEPLHVAPDGRTVLDGRHRLRAAVELGLKEVPIVAARLQGRSELEYVIRAALLRRHLSDDQRAVLAARLAESLSEERRSGRARTAAEARWRPDARRSAVTSKHPPLGSRREEPSRELVARGFGVPARKVRVAGALSAVAPELAQRVLDGDLKLREAEVQWQRERHIEELRLLPEPTPDERGRVWTGDFRTLSEQLPPESVGMVMTDPPYNEAGLPLWADLARVSARVLQPGGFLIAYSGHLFLPEVMTRLGAELTYYWIATVPFRGPKPSIHERQVRTGFRVVLIYVKPPIGFKPWFFDVIEADRAPDKRYHVWGQTVRPGRYLVSRFSKPGELVLDPFCGAGTFPLAAVLEGRRGLGIELDPGHAKVAAKRVALGLADEAFQKTSETGEPRAAEG